jgi:hypothetical protein
MYHHLEAAFHSRYVEGNVYQDFGRITLRLISVSSGQARDYRLFPRLMCSLVFNAFIMYRPKTFEKQIYF